MDTKNIENYLNSFGKEVVKNAKGNLQKGGKGGGKLEKSIKFKVVPDTNGFKVQFLMADYGTFQDKGVKGAGGTIKSGKHKGSWGGRRYYTTWQGKRKDSPYKFGSGRGTGSIGGQYMTTVGLKIAIVKVLWTKGIHGISFFQNSLMLGMKKFGKELLANVQEDIIDNIKQTTVK